MDFRDTPELAAFRRECRAWIDQALQGFESANDSVVSEKQSRWWQEKIHQGGWAGLSWPKDYGGRGLTVVHEAIFNGEAAARGAPLPINVMGMSLAGPTIIVHGTAAQKAKYLPKILSGEEIWCQGFSEPSNGSDLAGLRTRAERHGDGWLVNGQKVWTSWAHLAKRCMLLARTDGEAAKHKGITYFLADTDQFDIRPLVLITGDREFNEMFLDDVTVGDDDILGKLNDGWRVALTTLSFERMSLAFILQVWAREMFDRLLLLVRELGLAGDAGVAEKIGDFEARVEAVRIGGIRGISAVTAGGQPGPESSTVKLVWAHVIQDMARFALMIGGQDLLTPKGNHAMSFWLSRYLRARGHSIEGGTDEIQKSIVAERVLGLPRSR
ncbi:MAG: acyl-CoA dehydrogenase [Sphingomonadales bacterium]